jgi:hypothetical protein
MIQEFNQDYSQLRRHPSQLPEQRFLYNGVELIMELKSQF